MHLREKRELINNLRGKCFGTIKDELTGAGLRYVIEREDSKTAITTCDYNPDRLRLCIDNGVISGVTFG